MKKLLFLIFIASTFYCNAHDYEILQDTTYIVEDGMKYKSFIDAEYVYVNVSTRDPKKSMSILRDGLIIYYDMKGIEKKNVSIQYPMRSNEPPQSGKNNRERPTRDEQHLERLQEMIKELSEFGTFKFNDTSATFHKELNAQNIILAYYIENGELNYEVKIPKSEISKDADFSKLSIGVLTPEMPKRERLDRALGRQNSGNNQRGGGRGGGRGGRGGGKQQQGNRGQEDGNQQRERVQIEFWFKAIS